VLALSNGEIAKHSTLILTFADGSPMQTLGFSNNQTAIEVERDDIAGMVQQIGLALGLSPLPTYDPKAKMITFPVNIAPSIPGLSLPFSFAENLGLIAEANLSGHLTANVNLSLGLTLGFDFSAVEVPMILNSPLVPVPSNGRLSADAHFTLFLNGDPGLIHLVLGRGGG
jgi:hypothetical protein